MLPHAEYFYHHLDNHVAKGGQPQTQDAEDTSLAVSVLTALAKQLDGDATFVSAHVELICTDQERADCSVSYNVYGQKVLMIAKEES